MPKQPSILNFSITPPPSSVATAPLEEETFSEDEAPLPEPLPEPVAEEPELIEFVKKPEIVEDEIFATTRKKGQPTRSTSPKKTQRRPRKQLSEEDKEKRREALARGRATRMKNLAEKKRLEQERLNLQHQDAELDNESKALDLELKNAKLNKKAKKVKQVMIQDSSEEEIEYVKAPKKKPHSPPPRESITAEDVERAQLNTLLAYEKMRKDRKAEKKRIKEIEQQQEQIKQTMKQVNHQQPAWGRHRGAGKYGNLLGQMGL